MDNGWDRSADAWLALLGQEGDFSRVHVLDAPMMARVVLTGAQSALDVGCGEGRFCRMLAATVPEVIGLDPTRKLLDAARAEGGATYVTGTAEALPFADARFDLVVNYLTLIDIADARRGLREMVRVLRPGGHLLIANLNAWKTGSLTKSENWQRDGDGAATMTVDRYLEEHVHWGEWAGMRIQNWHRPLSFYMTALLDLGLKLTHFDEPRANGGALNEAYNCAPFLMMMEWKKPGERSG